MDLDLEAHRRSADFQEEEAPPSYYASLRGNVKNSTFISYARVNDICRHEQPPTTNWFVRSSSDPSIWQLLASGPLMSNVTTSANNTPSHKRQYRVLYPVCKYEDVYLHRQPWTARASAFPPYHIEIYSGRSRYNAEGIVILGAPQVQHDASDVAETRALACVHTPRAIYAVEDQVKNMTRQATFAEMEFLSWDWTRKTSSANHDMRTMILRAKEVCQESGADSRFGAFPDLRAW